MLEVIFVILGWFLFVRPANKINKIFNKIQYINQQINK